MTFRDTCAALWLDARAAAPRLAKSAAKNLTVILITSCGSVALYAMGYLEGNKGARTLRSQVSEAKASAESNRVALAAVRGDLAAALAEIKTLKEAKPVVVKVSRQAPKKQPKPAVFW